MGTPGNPPGASGQDTAKVALYAGYLRLAYQTASDAVETLLQAVGSQDGKPN